VGLASPWLATDTDSGGLGITNAPIEEMKSERTDPISMTQTYI
jgi:hypothetical protein